MNNWKTVIMAAVILSGGLLAAPNCHATIYKYIDKDGLTTFADDLQSIPAQYRAQAIIVSGETKEPEVRKPVNAVIQKTQTEMQERAASAPDITGMKPAAETGDSSAFGKRAMFSAIVVVSTLFAFVILGTVDKDRRKSIKIVRVVILWGVSVFLLYSHAMDVVGIIRSTGRSITDAQQMSEEKGKKAVRVIKELNTLAEQSKNANSDDPSKTDPERKE